LNYLQAEILDYSALLGNQSHFVDDLMRFKIDDNLGNDTMTLTRTGTGPGVYATQEFLFDLESYLEKQEYVYT